MIMRALAAILVPFVVVLSAACDRSSSSTGPAPASSGSSAAAAAGPVAETDAFRAELKSVGTYKKGEAATYEVVIKAKGPYHVNDEYPAKFKTADGNGVKHVEAKLERNKHVDAFATEPCAQNDKDACTLKITVRFTPEQAGTVRLGGTVDVGVCNKDQCLVEKKQLDLAVPVT